MLSLSRFWLLLALRERGFVNPLKKENSQITKIFSLVLNEVLKKSKNLRKMIFADDVKAR